MDELTQMTMNKTYQIKSVDAKGQPTMASVEAASGKGPLTLKVQPGQHHTLVDVQQASAPDNVRVQRIGKNLRIFFDGSAQPDLILEDYFGGQTDAPSMLTGITDEGSLREYMPESGRQQDTLTQLSDNSPIQGMALGGTELPAQSGAAVGLLAPAGGLGLGAAGAGLLGAAALGGGSSTPPKPVITALTLAAESDSGPVGDLITQNQSPQIKGKATPLSEVTVVLNGNMRYTATADANGDFSINLGSANQKLNPGRYALQATAVKNGVTSDPFNGVPFTIDISAGDNFDAAGNSIADVNTGATLTGLSLSDDTGPSSDLTTSVQNQKFTGTLANYINNGDRVMVTLSKVGDTHFAPLSAYLTPNAQNQWVWDQSALTLANGKYTLQSVLVDGAGNEIHGAAALAIRRTDAIIVSTGNGKIVNPDGSVTDDDNTINKASVLIASISNDTGVSHNDFVTNDNSLIFKGSLEHFTNNGDLIKLTLRDSTGAVVQTSFLTPSGNTWTWDATSLKLADGSYELLAAIVDAAGNTVKDSVTVSQKIAVDSSISKNHSLSATTDDANSSLSLVMLNMTDSADGFHASTSSDKITSNPHPSFSGNFGIGNSWSTNSDNFQLQIYKQDGTLVASKGSIASNGKSWTLGDWGNTTLTDGMYIAKASITDTAGNVLSMVQQTFAVDQTAPSLQYTQTLRDITLTGDSYTGGQTVSNFSLSSNEAMHYVIKTGDSILAEGDYTGLASTTSNIIKSQVFAPGTFTVLYTDTAGNTSSYTNAIELHFTADTAVKTAIPNQTYITASNPNLTLGSIGKLTLDATNPALDLTAVINNGNELHNHIDMGTSGSQQVSLNLNDVLILGVNNSFKADGLQQLRIDGNMEDRVMFKDRSAWTLETSSVDIGNGHYTLYTSHDSHGVLLEVLIAQGIQVS